MRIRNGTGTGGVFPQKQKLTAFKKWGFFYSIRASEKKWECVSP